MLYTIDLSRDAERDFLAAPRLIQRAIRLTLIRLQAEGPCLGTRLRSAGFDRFCRIEVRGSRDPRWRVVYQWPPVADAATDEIRVWAVGTHSEDEDDVYRALAAVLGANGITVGSWDATELPEPCCAPDPNPKVRSGSSKLRPDRWLSR